MANGRGLHPAFSFAASIILVGGMLYLLEASLEVTERLPVIETVMVPISVEPAPPLNAEGASGQPIGLVAGDRTSMKPLDARPLRAEFHAQRFMPDMPEARTALSEYAFLSPPTEIKSTIPADMIDAPTAAVIDVVKLVPGHAVGESHEIPIPVADILPSPIVGIAPKEAAPQPPPVAKALPPDRTVFVREVQISASTPDPVDGDGPTPELVARKLAPDPDLPVRRPAPPKSTAEAAERIPAPTTRQALVSTRQHAKPMTLGPAEAPRTQTKTVATSAGYQAKVWSALARSKPRAGKQGSATVSFGINAAGGLAFVRIGRSSGDPRLDQLALGTVRAAAPFPPPPDALSSRPYTIRIDFN
jgi:periplasmic protein TonB